MYVNMFLVLALKLTEICKQQFREAKIPHEYFHTKMQHFQEMSLFRCPNYSKCQNNNKRKISVPKDHPVCFKST